MSVGRVTSFSAEPISEVSHQLINVGEYTEEKQSYDRRVSDLFSVLTPDQYARDFIYSSFSSIRVPNGQPYLDLTRYEIILEVIALIFNLGNSNLAYNTISQAATNFPTVPIPWSFKTEFMQRLNEKIERDMAYETMKPSGILRPDGLRCKCNQEGSDMVRFDVKITRRIDEEFTTNTICVGCGNTTKIKS